MQLFGNIEKKKKRGEAKQILKENIPELKKIPEASN